MWSKDNVRGHVRDILFKDIEVTATACRLAPAGLDAEHLVQRVTVENLRINGKIVTSPTEGGFSMNKFAQDPSSSPNEPNLAP